MYSKKKPMTETEKKAKLTVLKDAHGQASSALKDKLSGYKSSKELKSHTKEMSADMKHDLEDDSDHIVDPTHHGNVIGRHVSDEQIECEPSDSDYNLEEIDARIRELVAQKEKAKRG